MATETGDGQQLAHATMATATPIPQRDTNTTGTASSRRRLRVPPELAIVAALFIVALAFDCYRLGTTSVWFDEAFSFELAQLKLGLMHAYVWGPFQNMALYYVLLHFWLKVTSGLGIAPTELVLRLPSAIAAAAGTGVLYALGRRFWGRAAGLTAAGLYLLNDLQLYGAQQARSYAFELPLVCASTYCFLAALTSNRAALRRRWWAGWALCSSLAVYTHLFSGLVVVAQVIAFVGLLALRGSWRKPARQSRWEFAAATLAAGVLIAPMAVDVMTQGGESTWIPAARLADLYNGLLLGISGGSVWFLLLLGAASCAALAAASVRYFGAARPAGDVAPGDAGTRLAQPRAGAFVLACWFVVPIVLSFATTQPGFNLHLFYPRYLMVVVPPLCLLCGIAVSLVRWPAPQVILALALVVAALAQTPHYYANAQVEDYRSTSFWLEQRYIAGDGIACFPSDLCEFPVDYYLHAYPTAAHFDADSPGRYDWGGFYAVNADVPTIQTYGAKHRRVFLVSEILVKEPWVIQESKVVRQWMDTHYTLVGAYSTSTVSVRLYDTGG